MGKAHANNHADMDFNADIVPSENEKIIKHIYIMPPQNVCLMTYLMS